MFGCSFFWIKAIAVWLPESRQAIMWMLPWLPYVHCTKLNPSSGRLELNGEKSCPLESSADPFSCPAALCSGALRLLDNCGRSRTAARRAPCRACRQPPAAPTQWHHLHPKLGCEKQSCESRGGAKGVSLNLALGSCVLAWFREQSFSLPLWTKKHGMEHEKEQFGGLRTCLMAVQIPDRAMALVA